MTDYALFSQKRCATCGATVETRLLDENQNCQQCSEDNEAHKNESESE